MVTELAYVYRRTLNCVTVNLHDTVIIMHIQPILWLIEQLISSALGSIYPQRQQIHGDSASSHMQQSISHRSITQ
jgi:hypothetical protein